MRTLRNTQWLSGLELFDFELNQNLEAVLELESFFGSSLPSSIRQYLLHLNPINTFDNSNYEESVQFEDCNIVFDNQIKAFDGFHTCHNIDEIIFRLKEFDEEISKFCRQNKVIPICPAIPAHDVFYSFKSGESFGKLYYDYEYEFLTDNEHLFANSIWDFICNIKIIEDIN